MLFNLDYVPFFVDIIDRQFYLCSLFLPCIYEKKKKYNKNYKILIHAFLFTLLHFTIFYNQTRELWKNSECNYIQTGIYTMRRIKRKRVKERKKCFQKILLILSYCAIHIHFGVRWFSKIFVFRLINIISKYSNFDFYIFIIRALIIEQMKLFSIYISFIYAKFL